MAIEKKKGSKRKQNRAKILTYNTHNNDNHQSIGKKKGSKRKQK